jgi:DinB family protein
VSASFSLEESIPVLARTPTVLRDLLADLPEPWLTATEGAGTWSPYDVVGHLIHGERTDWIPRVEHILHHGDSVAFPPFDRVAMFETSQGKSLAELLDAFAELRVTSLDRLRSLVPPTADLNRTGRHPEFGSVTLGQHLSTWVAHDLSHIGQIVRVMARRYTDAVGPWRRYLPLLGRP